MILYKELFIVKHLTYVFTYFNLCACFFFFCECFGVSGIKLVYWICFLQMGCLLLNFSCPHEQFFFFQEPYENINFINIDIITIVISISISISDIESNSSSNCSILVYNNSISEILFITFLNFFSNFLIFNFYS